jgi:hypothetical protein
VKSVHAFEGERAVTDEEGQPGSRLVTQLIAVKTRR